MTTSKHIWLTSAAVLLGLTGAQGADLPFRKAAPVDYVRICDAFSATGFFYIPGTDTCLRVAGQVRAEETFRVNAPTGNAAAYAYNFSGQVYRRDLTNFRARAYLNADARTMTAYGTLRAFVSYRITNDTTSPGPLGGRGATGLGGVPAGVRASTGFYQGGPAGSYSLIDKSFIQFAGITAGRSNSFFDFDAQSVELINNSVANSNTVTNLLSYTATFGGGFSATVGVEDATMRRTGDNGTNVFSATNPFIAGTPAGNINSPLVTVNGAGVVTNQTAGIIGYAGQEAPDVVGNVRYDAEWGSAQISGAYHELNSLPVAVLTRNSVTGAVATGVTRTPTAAGFAVQAGVKILVPTIAKGDYLTLQGIYDSGAMDYANSNNYFNGLSGIYSNNTNQGVPVNDAFVNTAGKIVTARAYGGYAVYKHYWIPEVSSALYGAYLQIDNPLQAQRLGAGTDNARIFQIGFNTIWTPVKDFQIGAEGLYSNMLLTGATVLPTSAPSGTAIKNPDDFRARLSFRRAF